METKALLGYSNLKIFDFYRFARVLVILFQQRFEFPELGVEWRISLLS